VRQHQIPKPGGGVRTLGIPTVLDRFIQQAVLQVLQPRFDPTFSASSYGFRPGRRAQDAVCQAQRSVQSGRRWVVDVDLATFFDRVNHDVLMGKLSQRIADRRVLALIRRFLEAGIMVNGVVQERHEGTPQGGPLSPLLANVLLDEVDKVLERRGHRFARYADDCNVYVRSQRAGERVMEALVRCTADHVFRSAGASAPCLTLTSTHRTAGCGPACPVVWEGSRRVILSYSLSPSSGCFAARSIRRAVRSAVFVAL
jgi:group II intron reverse transcriptase/maturase